MTYAAAPRFEIGRVLSRMSGVVARNFLVFAGLALILSGLPHLLATLVERDVTRLTAGSKIGGLRENPGIAQHAAAHQNAVDAGAQPVDNLLRLDAVATAEDRN